VTNESGRCSKCGAEVEDNARFCSNCGASFTGALPAPARPPVRPAAYQFDIVRAKSHDALVHLINQAAQDGWEPVAPYAWNTSITQADHACLVRKLLQ
jgi:hypothetical protein